MKSGVVGLTLVLSCSFGISACTGMAAKLPDNPQRNAPDVNVIPITPELVLEQRAARATFALTAEAGEGDTGGVPGFLDRARYQYRVGAGDRIAILVPSLATLSGISAGDAFPQGDLGYVVSQDGTIFVPFVGPVRVAGLAPDEIHRRVSEELARFIRTPQVNVAVVDFRSQKAFVTGSVKEPGFQPITDIPLSVTGALSTAGVILGSATDSAPKLDSKELAAIQPDLTRVELTRGGKTFRVNVDNMIRTGNLEKDLLLQDGDVLHVPSIERKHLFLLGEVKSGGSLVQIVEDRTTLAELLSAAGGLNQKTAKASRVYVIRGDYTEPRIFQLDASSPDALLLADGFNLKSRDVVYVAEAGISRWNNFLTNMLPSIQAILLGTVVSTQVGN